MDTTIIWQCAHATQAGSGKAENPTRNQDACHLQWLGMDRGLFVIADGAGSAPRSRQGAMLAAHTLGRLTGHLAPLLVARLDQTELAKRWQRVTREEFRRTRDLLGRLALRLECDRRELASTAMLVAFAPDRVLCAHVGDGRAAYSLAPGHWQALFMPHHGAMMGETVFLTSDLWDDDEFWPDCTRVITQPIRALAGMTDGVERGAFVCAAPKPGHEDIIIDPNTPYPPFFEGVLGSLRDLLDGRRDAPSTNRALSCFLRDGLEAFRTTEDDKTLVFIARAQSARQPQPCMEAVL